MIRRVLLSGAAASVASATAASLCSYVENGHAARPMNAVTHILDGGVPPPHNGHFGRNTAIGFAIHTAASVFWAVFFEGVLERLGKRTPVDAVVAGAGIAATAYVVDYGVVGRRFRPGFERYLSSKSMFAVYAALGAGFAVGAILTRKLRTGYGIRSRRSSPKVRRPPGARRRAAEAA